MNQTTVEAPKRGAVDNRSGTPRTHERARATLSNERGGLRTLGAHSPRSKIPADRARDEGASERSGTAGEVHQTLAKRRRSTLQEELQFDRLTVPCDWLVAARGQLSNYIKQAVGDGNDVFADDADFYLFSGMLNGAETYFRERGSMAGYSVRRFFLGHFANFLDWQTAKVRYAPGGCVSLNQPVGEGEEMTVEEITADRSNPEPMHDEVARILLAAMERLPENLRLVVVEMARGVRQIEIARALGITDEAIAARRSAARRRIADMTAVLPELSDVISG